MLEFIDTHQHCLWRARFSYGWTEGLEVLAGDFTPSDFRALTRDDGVVGAIFMEASADDAVWQAEAGYAASLVKTGEICGFVAGCRPEEDAGFDEWLEEAVALGVNGFRRILHVMPDDLSQSQTFRANLHKIGRHGLPFDLVLRVHQLPIGLDLVRACADQVFVLDHAGNPDIANNGFAQWSASIAALAREPNVYAKLSGLTPLCAQGTANAVTLRPWVDHLLDCFGPSRIVWGSDWPVVNFSTGLRDWIAITRSLLSGLSPDEQIEIAQGNARRLYRV